jgi:hypothetical protein
VCPGRGIRRGRLGSGFLHVVHGPGFVVHYVDDGADVDYDLVHYDVDDDDHHLDLNHHGSPEVTVEGIHNHDDEHHIVQHHFDDFDVVHHDIDVDHLDDRAGSDVAARGDRAGGSFDGHGPLAGSRWQPAGRRLVRRPCDDGCG